MLTTGWVSRKLGSGTKIVCYVECGIDGMEGRGTFIHLWYEVCEGEEVAGLYWYEFVSRYAAR
jgi:hypothetical protein